MFNRQLEMLYQHTKMKLKDACEAIFEFLAQVTTHEGGCAIVLGFSFDICRSEISASKHRINSGFFLLPIGIGVKCLLMNFVLCTMVHFRGEMCQKLKINF